MPTLLLQLEGVVVLPGFFRGAVAPLAQALRSQHAEAPDPAAAAWRAAFTSGALTTNPHRDVVRSLRRWQAEGVRVVAFGAHPADGLADALRHTTHGDLRALFDDVVGAEAGPADAVATWQALSARYPDALAVVDAPATAEAAAAAGWRVHRLDRVTGRGLDDVAP